MDNALERIFRQGLEQARASGLDYVRQTEEAVRLYRSARAQMHQHGDVADVEASGVRPRRLTKPEEPKGVQKPEDDREEADNDAKDLLDIPDFLRRT